MAKMSFLFLMLFYVTTARALEDLETFKVDLGEKLFLEDRFSQGFFKQHDGDYNSPAPEGASILEQFEYLEENLPHPQRGQQVSCASCHFVDQMTDVQEGLVLTYNDFSAFSRVPARGDQQTRTPRNSMNMVLPNAPEGGPLHWDGEFYSPSSLTCATLVGRNMGWLLGEESQARQHVVNVLRKDSGTYPSVSELKGSYAELFKKIGIELTELSDPQLLELTCNTVGIYLKDLDFAKDEDGQFIGSAYDQFLLQNGVRSQRLPNETQGEYLTYLKDQVRTIQDWQWIEPSPMKYHNEDSVFGPKELQGLKAFLGRSQCATCHRPPEFTDYRFHNTGISQFTFDSLHGRGAFSNLKIPSHNDRLLDPASSFVGTENHPHWQGDFRKSPEKDEPKFVDLGIWNIIGHPDKKEVQPQVKKMICESYQLKNCEWSDEEYLTKSIALFKTPTLRSLGQSAPYLHDGSAEDILSVLTLYLRGSHFAQKGQMRNPDPFMRAMSIHPHDFRALEAFLQSLNEDYD